MKFLVFNIVVAAALVFLFAGEDAKFGKLAQTADTKIGELKASMAGLLSEKHGDVQPLKISQNRKAPQNTPDIAKDAHDIAKDAQKLKTEGNTTEPPATKSEASPAYKVMKNPSAAAAPLEDEVLKRRDEVLAESDVAETTEDKNSFMLPRTRKRELMFLAEEMEILAAKIANE